MREIPIVHGRFLGIPQEKRSFVMALTESANQEGRIVSMHNSYDSLRDRTKRFAIAIVRFYRTLPPNEEARIIGRQLPRSGISVGANYRAACRGRSKAEFIAKLGIVLEEADEAVFWSELLEETSIVRHDKIGALTKEADELTFVLRNLYPHGEGNCLMMPARADFISTF